MQSSFDNLDLPYGSKHDCPQELFKDDEKSSVMSGSCKPNVTLVADHSLRVLSSDSGFWDLFGFKSEETRRSLKMIFGPSTNLTLLQELVSDANFSNGRSESFVFYHKSGDEVPCTVTAMTTPSEGLPLTKLYFYSKKPNVEFKLNSMTGDSMFSLETDLSLGSVQVDNSVLIHMRAMSRAVAASRLCKND